jgi:predicted nucleotidyltransferase component of viral defense system
MILTPLQKKFLEIFFKSFLGQRFFLSGGTALAEFYLKHRLSQDLDLFTVDQDLGFDSVNTEINKMAKNLDLIIEHQIASPSFLQYIFKDKSNDKSETLKVDVVKDVPIHFGSIKKSKGINIDSLENISVGKLLAAFGRADAKDFIDLYFLFKEKKVDFDNIFTMAKKKDLGLSEFYLAHMLNRVKEIKNFPKTIKPFDKKELIDFFLNLSDKLFKKIKPT